MSLQLSDIVHAQIKELWKEGNDLAAGEQLDAAKRSIFLH